MAGDLGGRGMEKEAIARNRAGLTCEFLSGRELRARYGIDRTGAIFARRGGGRSGGPGPRIVAQGQVTGRANIRALPRCGT